MPRRTQINYAFKDRIDAVVATESYIESEKNGGWVSFEVHAELTFPMIHQIQEILGTDNIKLGSGYSDGGCDSCGYGNDNWLTVEARGIVFP